MKARPDPDTAAALGALMADQLAATRPAAEPAAA
jgi:hypothetical protein